MKRKLNLEQLCCFTLSSMLMVMIAVLCLRLSANTITVFPRKSNIAIKLNKSLAENTSCIHFSSGPALLSAPYTIKLAGNRLVYSQMRALDRLKEKASNIKKKLSLTNRRIVTA